MTSYASLSGGNGDDPLIGTNASEILDGKGGNDTVFARDGGDSIFGGPGDDRIYAGSGQDLVFGQNGNDTAYGQASHDTLSGGAGNDFLDGGNGQDELDGGIGDDTILGGRQDDYITGGDGDDSLEGGGVSYQSGNPTQENPLNDGSFQASGNQDGNDTFYFDSGFGNDRIGDFEIGKDVLEIKAGINGEQIAQPSDLAAFVGEDGALNAVITIGGDSITLVGVSKATLLGNLNDAVDIV